MNVSEPALLAKLPGLLVGFVPDRAVLYDFGAVRARCIHFGLRGVRGHHHDGFHLVNARRNGDALRVISGRRTDYAALSLLRGEVTELVQRSADFVRSAFLKHLRLQTNVEAGAL